MRARLLVLTTVLSACGGTTPQGAALRVEITWQPDVTAQCFKLRVEAAGRTVESQPAVRSGKSSLQVGVFQKDLPEDVQLEAVGYADEACSIESVPAETSGRFAAHFGQGVTPITLLVERAQVGATDAGTDAGNENDAGTSDAGTSDAGTSDAGTSDAGTSDAGTSDAGTSDSGTSDSGTADAGADAGSADAGSDAGASDAGVDGGTDAGVPEICNNRLDDDGDLLVDCADPGCGNGTACNDADLCSVGEVCGGGACGGGTFTCIGSGNISICYALSGCDAGVCLGTPVPPRTFCDGGQCDGNGRCAPFCDATEAGLRACYQFENVLTDDSGKGNHGSADAGTFVPGSRGLAYRPGATGIDAGDSASLECTTALTMEAWVRLSAWPDAGMRYGVLDNNGQYGIFIGPGGELRCSAGIGASAPGAIGLNAWHHLGCVFNGPAYSLRSYVDGVQVDALDAGLNDGGVRVLTAGDDAGLRIGEQSPSGDVLNGSVDGVRIWCVPRAQADLCTTLGECG